MKAKNVAKPSKWVIKPNRDYYAVFETSLGKFTIKFFIEEAPKTVNNFVYLAQKSFYEGTIFHRVIADFMIQGGDPEGTGKGGPGYQFADEINALKLTRGRVAMANSGPDTNGSQFFIVTTEATPWLDGNHTVFGEVVEGILTIDKIETVETSRNDRPLIPITIDKVTILDK